MKKELFNLRRVLIGAAIALISTSLMAQQGTVHGKFNADRQTDTRFCSRIPDLTPEQEKKINDLRTEQLKEMNSYRSDMMIQRAELNQLQTAENAEINKINAKIEEIGKMKTGMAKKKAAHMQTIRSILTEEQRVYFDTRQGKRSFYGNREMPGDREFSPDNYGSCPRKHL